MPLSLERRTLHRARATPLGPPLGPPPIRETDLDRLLKLIPTEVIALYVAAAQLVLQVPWRYYAFTLFVAGVVLVPIILFLDGRNTHQPAAVSQYVLRILAFIAWASAISWPFAPWLQQRDFEWARALIVVLVPGIGAILLRERPSNS
jgi:hypothetical protein